MFGSGRQRRTLAQEQARTNKYHGGGQTPWVGSYADLLPRYLPEPTRDSLLEISRRRAAGRAGARLATNPPQWAQEAVGLVRGSDM